MLKVKVTTRKWNGDDAYSWAVFRSDQIEPVFTGCERAEARYYKKMVVEAIEKGGDLSATSKQQP